MESIRFSVGDIEKKCKATILRKSHSAQDITAVITDSRHIADGVHALFIALKGVNHNGHLFLSETYDKGVRTFLISEPEAASALPDDCTVFQVADTLVALQSLAAAHRKKFNIPVLAITGSNGKTMVKEWLYQLLSPDTNIIRSPKSYNSQVGVPLSVFNLSAAHNLAIFEAGI